MADELEFVCEKCVHYEVCDRSSRMIWARLSKEKVCTDFMEMVRCKDCKHYVKDTMWCKVNSNPRSATYPNWYADDFCSYGERRTDDE